MCEQMAPLLNEIRELRTEINRLKAQSNSMIKSHDQQLEVLSLEIAKKQSTCKQCWEKKNKVLTFYTKGRLKKTPQR